MENIQKSHLILRDKINGLDENDYWLYYNTNKYQLVLINQAPGKILDLPFFFILMDSKQKVYLLTQLETGIKPVLKIQPSDLGSYFERAFWSIEEKNVILSFITYNEYRQKLNSLTQLKIFDQEKSYKSYLINSQITNQFTNSLQFSIIVLTRNCIKGELQKHLRECYRCPIQKYSLQTKNDVCRNCVKNAICPGGDLILANKHFWQISNHSNIIVNCEKYKEYCLGGQKYQLNPCSGGHYGPLCRSCDSIGQYTNGIQYFRSTSNINCDLCPKDLKKNLIIIISLSLTSIVITTYLLIGSQKSILNELIVNHRIPDRKGRKKIPDRKGRKKDKINKTAKKTPSFILENPNILVTLIKKHLTRKKEEHSIQIQNFFLKHKKLKEKMIKWFKSSKDKQDKKIGEVKYNQVKNKDFSIMMKLMTHYFQSLTMVFTYKIPITLFFISEKVSGDPRQVIYNLQCILAQYVPNLYFISIILELLSPYFYLIVILLLWVVFKRKEVNNFIISYLCFQQFKKSKLFGLYIILFINQQQTQISMITNFLKCQTLDKEYTVNFINPEIQCYNEYWYHYAYRFIYPSLFLWLIFYPFLLILGMRSNNKNLQQIRVIIKYSFIFVGYNSYSFLWEFNKILMRNLMLMAHELILKELYIKEITLGIILLIYCVYVYKLRPYNKKDHNIFNLVDFLINLALLFNISQSHLINSVLDQKNAVLNFDITQTIIIYVTLCLNGLLILFLTRIFVVIIKEAKIRPVIQKIISYLEKKEFTKWQKIRRRNAILFQKLDLKKMKILDLEKKKKKEKQDQDIKILRNKIEQNESIYEDIIQGDYKSNEMHEDRSQNEFDLEEEEQEDIDAQFQFQFPWSCPMKFK